MSGPLFVQRHSADAGWLSWPECELPDKPATDGAGPLFYNPVSGLRRALGLHAHAWHSRHQGICPKP